MLIIAVSFISGVLFTFISRSIAKRLGIVSHPNPIVPQHTCPIAYLGGVGVWIAITATLLLFSKSPVWGTMGPAAAIMLVGLVDDLHPLSPWTRLALQILLGMAAVATGTILDLTHNSLVDGAISLAVILIFVNAFNLTDVSDGLVALLAMLGCLGTLILGYNGSYALAVAGACLGFLVFNGPSASIFLGDAGSYLLGFTAAVLVINPSAVRPVQPTDFWSFTGLILLFLIPLLETTLLMIARFRKGIPLHLGSPDHFALRLQERGMNKWGVLVSSGIVAVTFCAGGYFLHVLTGLLRSAALVSVILLSSALIILLLRMDCSQDTEKLAGTDSADADSACSH